jgi:hypothetical protein
MVSRVCLISFSIPDQHLCCRKCVIASHKNCKDIVIIGEVVDNVKNSSSVQEMEHLLDDLTKNIKAITLQYVWYFSRCSSQNGVIPMIKGGNFWYSPMVIVTWSRVALARL